MFSSVLIYKKFKYEILKNYQNDEHCKTLW